MKFSMKNKAEPSTHLYGSELIPGPEQLITGWLSRDDRSD